MEAHAAAKPARKTVSALAAGHTTALNALLNCAQIQPMPVLVQGWSVTGRPQGPAIVRRGRVNVSQALTAKTAISSFVLTPTTMPKESSESATARGFATVNGAGVCATMCVSTDQLATKCAALVIQEIRTVSCLITLLVTSHRGVSRKPTQDGPTNVQGKTTACVIRIPEHAYVRLDSMAKIVVISATALGSLQHSLRLQTSQVCHTDRILIRDSRCHSKVRPQLASRPLSITLKASDKQIWTSW